MIRIRFAGRNDAAPWRTLPLGAADAWIAGVRKLPAVRGSAARPAGVPKKAAPGGILHPAAIGPCGFTGAVNLGNPADLTAAAAEALGRRIGAAAARPGVRRLFVDADLFPETAAALAAGLALRAEPRLSLKSRVKDPFADPAACPKEAVILSTNPAAAAAAWESAAPAVEAALWARRLADEPANRLGPDEMQAAAESLVPLGVRVSTIAGEALLENRLALIHAVGRGSARPPRLIVLSWPGANPKAAPLALIGKGIVFDTGGISIKPAERMEEMKGDMAGAAAVLGAVRAAAGRKSPLPVVGLLAVAENAVSGNATRPGDVVTARDGSTVEIVDTDAEGRLVLADALAHAREAFAPFLMVDLATLTGAVVRTLGAWHAGLFANADAAAARIAAAASASREPVWRLPLPGADDDALSSAIADIKNCAWGTAPDALHAAGFLARFAAKTPWAHLDIAGAADAPEETEQERGGPRGFGVRLLDSLIQNLETEPWTSSSAN
ncbi:MAG: M17 family metallopeptidase [Rhodospirillaceae bacterium]